MAYVTYDKLNKHTSNATVGLNELHTAGASVTFGGSRVPPLVLKRPGRMLMAWPEPAFTMV